MLFSRGRHPRALSDLGRLRDQCSPDEYALVEEAYALLLGLLRFDPHLQGRPIPDKAERVIVCGPVFVLHEVFPLDDRFVRVEAVGLNPAWVP
jgi:hypothetical protein